MDTDTETHASSLRSCIRIIAALILASLAAVTHVSAADEQPVSHVRAEDARLGALIDDGANRSPTFRALVEQLNRSDVFVYVERQVLPLNLNGRLTLVTTGEAWRYVRVQIDCRHMLVEQLAALGHELRHAVEIADSASTVDPTSVQRLYGTIGFALDSGGRRFETDAAVEAGRRVHRELMSRTATITVAAR